MQIVCASVSLCLIATARRVIRTSTCLYASCRVVVVLPVVAAERVLLSPRRQRGGAGNESCNRRRSAMTTKVSQNAATRTRRISASSTTAARGATCPPTSIYSAPWKTNVVWSGETIAELKLKFTVCVLLYSVLYVYEINVWLYVAVQTLT